MKNCPRSLIRPPPHLTMVLTTWSSQDESIWNTMQFSHGQIDSRNYFVCRRSFKGLRGLSFSRLLGSRIYTWEPFAYLRWWVVGWYACGNYQWIYFENRTTKCARFAVRYKINRMKKMAINSHNNYCHIERYYVVIISSLMHNP